jgi:hypothetical protein
MTYQTITNRIRTSSLKNYRTELTKKLIEQTEPELKSNNK